MRERLLTPFQARSLLAGEGRSFFITERYKILEHLGRGGMGEVYLVEQLLLRRVAAMKLILAGDPKSGSNGAGAVERFFREARAVAALDHPNVVRVFDMDRTPVGPFLVMEYVDGTNLHAVVADGGRLAVPRAVGYTAQAARGLEHAHLRGLVHRDVKPGNLMLDRTGAVKVVDLGLARYRDANKDAGLTGMYDDNRVIGTADFQAPEQGLDSGSADGRSDVYGLGATLFYLLASRVPFPEGTIANKLLAHQMKPVPDVAGLNPDVPPELAAVVGRMMAKRPADRPQTMTQVRAVLEPWAADELPPPAAAEMPARRAEQYRLGLVDAAPQFDAPPPAPSTRRASADHTGPPKSGSTIHVLAPPSSLPPLPPGAAARPRRRWLLFAAVQLLLLAATVAVTTYLNNYARQGLNTPPVRPPSEPVVFVPFKAGGSTLIQPLMREWTGEYQKQTGGAFEYDPVGSGKGVGGLRAAGYDVAFTDVFLTDAEIAEAATAGKRLVHVPVVMGAVVPVYHLPGYDDPLVLTGEVLADIYAGRITRWKDPKLVALNPPLAGYDRAAAITVVYRSDASGTTATFTEFLAKATAGGGWPRATKQFPSDQVGVGVEKNDGVAKAVQDTPGAVGYVELATALAGSLKYALVRNRDGANVLPSRAGVTAAADGVPLPDDLRFTAVYAPGPKAYPIAATTWAVFDANAPADKQAVVAAFLDWATRQDTDHLRGLETLGYVQLPKAVAAAGREKLKQARAAGGR